MCGEENADANEICGENYFVTAEASTVGSIMATGTCRGEDKGKAQVRLGLKRAHTTDVRNEGRYSN